MPEYRRWRIPGATYFFTVVTLGRRPILCDDVGRRCLHEAFDEVRKDWPFEIIAIVLLPDHLHAVWALPQDDDRYSVRWKLIKEEFTRRYLKSGGSELPRNDSRRKQGERGVWQRRFWEHTVRDEDDSKRCIHWNPKKHGYVAHVRDWQGSSFHRFVRLGEYDLGWGSIDPTPGYHDPEWGEWCRAW